MKSGIVYKSIRSYGSTYIGRTRRILLSRMKKHATLEKFEVCKHLLQHPTHLVDLYTPNILSSKGDAARLLILESWLIQEKSP